MPELTESICKERMSHIQDDIAELKRRVERDEGRMDDISKVTLTLERMAVTMDQILATQHDHEERLDKLEERDGKMWRDVIKYAITAVLGIVIGFIVNGVLPG